MHARLGIVGLYNYDQHLFDRLKLPEGASKDSFISVLIMSYGDLGVLYPDGDFMREVAIPAWSDKYEESLNRVWKSLSSEYDPIENYDRREEWTDSPDIHRDLSGNSSSAGSSSTDSTSTDTTNSNRTNELRKSAYNTGYNPFEKTTDDTSQSDKNFITSGSSSSDKTNSNSNEHEHGTTTHSGRIHGNIGVTTNQKMITEELELRKHTFYGYATSLFMQDLLMGVW